MPIPPSTHYCVILNDKVHARGNAKNMRKLAKQVGGKVGLGYGEVGSEVISTQNSNESCLKWLKIGEWS